MEYPKGTKFGNYIVCEESEGKYSIRRQITLPGGERKQPRYPKAKYAHLGSLEELDQFVNKLNYRQDQKKKLELEIRSSFIPQVLLDEFRELLRLEIPTQRDYRYQYKRCFQAYFLRFFIHQLNVLDPNEWAKHQSQWGAALLHQSAHKIFDRAMSKKTLIKVVQVANRFMSFLHARIPTEYPAVKFKPFSKGTLRAYSAQLKLNADEPEGRYIPPHDWATIEKALPGNIRPFVLLAYHYGLRRAESLGFVGMESVKKGYLKISQQMVKKAVYGPLKDRDARDTPHWLGSPAEAYKWISEGLDLKMHPDTLGQRFAKLMVKLKLPYEMHDLRRTFITRALRVAAPRDVQLAVGHASIMTTMAYAQDDRDLSNETYKPA